MQLDHGLAQKVLPKLSIWFLLVVVVALLDFLSLLLVAVVLVDLELDQD
jgi:hypothetical protein